MNSDIKFPPEPPNKKELITAKTLIWKSSARVSQWLSSKEPACQCRRHKRCGFDPWVGKILWRRAWSSTPGSLPGESVPRTEEPGGLQPIGLQKVRYNWSDIACTHAQLRQKERNFLRFLVPLILLMPLNTGAEHKYLFPFRSYFSPRATYRHNRLRGSTLFSGG